jgi:hypothetical protein
VLINELFGLAGASAILQEKAVTQNRFCS